MSSWHLTYDQWDVSQEKLREALCTLGNSYIAVRGASEESLHRPQHYHGTYLAGGYNRAETLISGKVIENEDLVNWPDFIGLNFRIGVGEWFTLENSKILEFCQDLNLKEGSLERKLRFIHEEKEFLLNTQRFVSMENPHLIGVKWELTCLNWEGSVEVISSIDGSVTNSGVERYQELNGKHLEVIERGLAYEDTIYLEARTNQSNIQMAIAARTSVFHKKDSCPLERKTAQEKEKIFQLLTFEVERNKPYTIEKLITVYTSRDFAISEPQEAARKLIQRVKSYGEEFSHHQRSWGSVWSRFDISLEGMEEETRILRLHIFHLLQTTCHNSIDRDVSIPARGLHGEAYRGHIFWDEMFIFPLVYFHMPELARSLLMYRYRRLDEARFLAKSQGYQGAMYPWQSGSDGREETQEIHLNPESGRWIPDNTHKQRHINGAVAYNIVKYYEATGDRKFISRFGAEIMLEIARFWVSLLNYDSQKKRYEIHGVVGPDEFHTKYPDSETLGINNNAYTNFIAAWTIKKVLGLLNTLSHFRKDELLQKLEISSGDLVQWLKVGKKIFIPMMEDGIIEQFEGFRDLRDIDWELYSKKYEDIQRMDRILEAEGDDINRYKINKQADVLMLFYLFSSEKIVEVFEWMSYEFRPTWILNNINYYMNYTSNGSSLSRVVHSWVLSRSDRQHAWTLFEEALKSDIFDIQGGTTSEGIHLGAMAGTVDIVLRCFTGLHIKDDVIWFSPLLPQVIKGAELSLCYRGHWLCLKLDHRHLTIKVERSWESKGKLGFKGDVYEFEEGSVFNFSLEDNHRQTQLS